MTLTTRRARAIVCEGPDDLAALRELLRRRHGLEAKGTKRNEEGGWLEATTRDVVLRIFRARGKSDLALRALDALQGTSGFSAETVAVCFDPDDDPEEREQDFLRMALRVHGATLAPQAQGIELAVELKGRPLGTLRVAPWRTSAPERWDVLPDQQNLERVLMVGIQRAGLDARLADWAKQSTEGLLGLVKGHGWKRAFRVWNAALHPQTESFVERLLQDDITKSHCLSAIADTPVGAMVAALLQVDRAPPAAPAGPTP